LFIFYVDFFAGTLFNKKTAEQVQRFFQFGVILYQPSGFGKQTNFV